MRPKGTPEWAEDGTNIVEPAQSKKDTGHIASEQVAAGYENWLKNKLAGYARGMGNAAFSQVRGTTLSSLSVNGRDLALRMKNNEVLQAGESAVDVWIVLTSAGKYNIVSDPYGKETGVTYEEGDLPGSGDGAGLFAVVYNFFHDQWIVAGATSVESPYSNEPKIATSSEKFPLVAGDWDAVNSGFAAVGISSLDWSVDTGTSFAAVEDGTGAITVLRSTDGGDNWSNASPTTDLERGKSVFSPHKASSIANGHVVVFGVEDVGGTQAVMSIFSDDDGVTWTDGTFAGASTFAGQHEAAAVCHNGTVWAAIHAHDDNTELYTSSDGLAWGTVALPAVIGTPWDISADEEGGLIFLVSENGFFYSETDGQDWKRAAPLQSPDPGADGELAPTDSIRIRIKVSPTGQIGIIGTLGGDPIAWWTPRQISRDHDYADAPLV